MFISLGRKRFERTDDGCVWKGRQWQWISSRKSSRYVTTTTHPRPRVSVGPAVWLSASGGHNIALQWADGQLVVRLRLGLTAIDPVWQDARFDW